MEEEEKWSWKFKSFSPLSRLNGLHRFLWWGCNDFVLKRFAVIVLQEFTHVEE